MSRKLDIAVGVAAVALVAAGVVASSHLKEEVTMQSTDPVLKASAAELLTVAQGQDPAALRNWLLAEGPDAVHRLVLELDNSNDRNAAVRMQVLRSIHSLTGGGLDAEAVKSWAVALRSLANTILHEGAERTDYIARSYVMEGRMVEAADEYRRYPTSTASVVFFEGNPDLRAPAGTKN